MSDVPYLRAGDIRMALRRQFPKAECAIVFEVAQATGFNAHRHLDAVAMDLWPSRGLALHGIEIKVSRADWKREKETPEKAEQIARFCDFFWLATPTNLVPIDDIPMNWGLIEVDAERNPKIVKRAAKLDPQPADRPFMAAMMRAAFRTMSQDDNETIESVLAARRTEQDKDFEERVKREAELRLGFRDKAAKNWNALVAAIGKEPEAFWEDKELIAAVKAVMKSGAVAAWSGLQSLEQSLRDAGVKIREGLDTLGIDRLPAAKKRRAKAS